MVRLAADAFGRLEVVVSNAGLDQIVPFEKITPQQLDRVFRTIVYGAFYVIQAALEAIPDGGRIILTGSITGIKGSAGMAHYAASKGALLALTLSLAEALRERRIRVETERRHSQWKKTFSAHDKT